MPAALRGLFASCPTHDVLTQFAEGKLPAADAGLVRAHLEVCTSCLSNFSSSDSGCETVLTESGSRGIPVVPASAASSPSPAGRASSSGSSGSSRPGSAFEVGTVIRKKYRIDGTLGTGGMGTVLRAHHLELDRVVAIKVMHGDLVHDAESARRFTAEARAAAALESANSVRILDIDRLDENGAPFIVMEFLEGEDLGALLTRETTVPYGPAVDYVLQALDALAEAHDRGIVHRDVKPQNLFLTRRGQVKVVDFGLAKTLSLKPVGGPGIGSGTQTKVMMGSPHYMSPEQIRSARRVDPRADIWAIGATLYHLLSGVPPFAAPNLFLLCARIINEAAPSLQGRVAGLPPLLDTVIQRCLRKNPNERYASCEELRVALQGALDATRLPTPRPAERPSAPAKASTPNDTAPMATIQFSNLTPPPGSHAHAPAPASAQSPVSGGVSVEFSESEYDEYAFEDATKMNRQSGTVDVTQPIARPRR